MYTSQYALTYDLIPDYGSWEDNKTKLIQIVGA